MYDDENRDWLIYQFSRENWGSPAQGVFATAAGDGNIPKKSRSSDDGTDGDGPYPIANQSALNRAA